MFSILLRLLRKSAPEISKILSQYGAASHSSPKQIEEPRINLYPLKYPQPCIQMNRIGKLYLRKRGFDPDQLETDWDLKQTGPVSFLDSIVYSNRILIPIYWGGEVVSFQSRDITGQSDRKYMACPMKRETLHHKDIVYKSPTAQKEEVPLIVVEGVTDVWRLGICAVATFGTSFKMEQVIELAGLRDDFIVMFDNERQAQEQAAKLAVKLRSLGKRVRIETVSTDPGDMEQEEANQLVSKLLSKRMN